MEFAHQSFELSLTMLPYFHNWWQNWSESNLLVLLNPCRQILAELAFSQTFAIYFQQYQSTSGRYQSPRWTSGENAELRRWSRVQRYSRYPEHLYWQTNENGLARLSIARQCFDLSFRIQSIDCNFRAGISLPFEIPHVWRIPAEVPRLQG